MPSGVEPVLSAWHVHIGLEEQMCYVVKSDTNLTTYHQALAVSISSPTMLLNQYLCFLMYIHDSCSWALILSYNRQYYLLPNLPQFSPSGGKRTEILEWLDEVYGSRRLNGSASLHSCVQTLSRL